MSITRREVEEIAHLARLELSPAEIDLLVRDLSSILDHMRELEAVEVAGVAPLGGVSEHVAPMRPDEAGADPLQRPISDFAPAWQENFFLVPRLAALDTDQIAAEDVS